MDPLPNSSLWPSPSKHGRHGNFGDLGFCCHVPYKKGASPFLSHATSHTPSSLIFLFSPLSVFWPCTQNLLVVYITLSTITTHSFNIALRLQHPHTIKPASSCQTATLSQSFNRGTLSIILHICFHQPPFDIFFLLLISAIWFISDSPLDNCSSYCHAFTHSALRLSIFLRRRNPHPCKSTYVLAYMHARGQHGLRVLAA